jgi:RND family efflux transporter MFP subunit
MKKTILISLIAVLFISACGKNNGDLTKKKNFKAENKKETALVVMVENVQLRSLDKFVRATGKLQGINDVNVLSKVSGTIVEKYKGLGDWVEKDEAIGRIDNTEYQNQLDQANAALMAAEAGLEMAKISMNAADKLYNNQQISENEYLQSKSNLKNAQANYDGAKANVNIRKRALDNSMFVAPISGYIAELNLEIGDQISQGAIVAGIVNSDKMILKTGISESDIKYVKKNNLVSIEVNDKEIVGKVTGLGIRPATGSNNYPIEIIFDNKDNCLFPGMVVESNILAKTFQNVIFTSVDNLREKYDTNFVYIINDDNRAETRVVELGEQVRNFIIIKSGLNIGDRLVTDGIDSLSENSLVKARNGFNSK